MLSLCVWDGDGGNNHWSNPANWLGGAVPGANDDLVFLGSAQTQTENDLAAGTAFRSLSFLSDSYSITGNRLAVTNRILVGPGASGTTIAVGVALNGSVRVTLVGGSLSLSGVISGNGSLTENGNGILVLEAGATYTGNTTIQSGATLQLGCVDALPSGPNAGAVKVNGTLDLGGYGGAVNGLSGHGVVTSSAPGLATLNVDTTQSSTFSGVIEDGLGTVALTTTGTGTLTLNGENTFSGVATIGEGSTLRLGNPLALPSDPEINGTLDLAGNNTNLDGLWGSGTITSSVSGAVTLTVDTSNYSGTFSGVIEDGSGTMAVTITGTGTQTLTGTNTFSGGTTVSQGTLYVGYYTSSGTLGSGAVVNNASLVFGRTGTTTFGNAISGSGTVTQTMGTLIFTGANTYSGTTTIAPSSWENATIQVGNGGTTGALGSGTVTSSGDYASYAQLVWNRSDGVTSSNVISGALNVTVASGSTLKAGSSTACGLPNGTTGTGSVTISGTFDLNGYSPTVGSLSGGGTVTSGVSGAATLTAHNNDYYSSSTFSGVIQDGSGTVALTKTGSGDLYLTGTNTHSGGVTISAGTLYIGYWGSSGTLGSGAVVNNAALVFNRTGTTTIANAISGTGTVTQTQGTVILTGANTYSGTTIIAPSTYDYVTLQVGNGGTAGTLGSGTVTSSGDYASYAQLVWNRSDGVTSSNAITGLVNVTVASGSTLKAGGSAACGLPNGTTGTGSVTISGTFDLNGYSPTVGSLSGSGTVTSGVSGAATLTAHNNDYYSSSTFSGVIQDGSGTVSLTKTGSGDFRLTGTNTFGGGTTISAGALYVGNYTASGTLGSGEVVNNASLVFYRTDSATIANAISGTGTVTQSYGTVTLTGANTYSGGTTISMGATLRVGGTSGTLGTGGVTCVYDYPYYPAGQLVFDRSTAVTVDNDISGFLSVMQEGSGALVLTGSNTYSQGTTINSGCTLRIGSNDPDVLPNGEGSGTVTVNGTLDLNGYSPSVGGLAGSGTVTSGVSGTATLTVESGEWEGSTFPGVIEDGSGTVSLTKAGAGALYLTGTNTHSGGTTISAGSLYLGNYTSTGTLGTGAVVNNAALVFNRSGTTTIANAISGSGTVTQRLGTVILTGSNTYSGTTTIYEDSTLQVGNGGTTGTLGSGEVTYADDYYSWTGYSQLVYNRSDGITVTNAITSSVNVTIAAGSTLRAGSSNTCGLPNGTTGTGTITVSGTLDLNGYSPTVGNLGGSGTVTSGVSGTATLTVSNGEWEGSTFPGVIEDGSGTVALTKAGAGDFRLTGANTFSGGVTISAGALYVGNYTASGTLGSGEVVNNASLVFYRTDSATIANVISGTGTVTQSYGTVTLTGANTYSGGTTISMGATLRVGGTSGTLGTGEVTCVYDYPYYPAGQLVFDRTATGTVDNDITGFLSVVQEGSGEVALTGSNTYTEGTTIDSGSTLRVGNGGTAGTLGSGNVAISSGGVLAFDRSDSFTVSNAMSGQGSFSQEGSGTLILTGQSSLGGATIGEGSTVQVEGSVTLTNPVTNEGTLRVVGAGVFTHAGTRISGSTAAVSAGEVFLTSTGLGTETTTFDFEISTDGVNYYPIATGGETDSQTMLSGLLPNTDYYLRGRVVHQDGSQEIYDGGMVTTSDGPGPGVPDTSGWYRIVCIRSDSYYGGELTPAPGSTAYVESRVLPQGTAEALFARDPQVQVFGATGSPPAGSQNIFKLDRSWFFAESPQAAVLQAVVGLVYDQTTPTITDGAIKVYHITHWHEHWGMIDDLWTFDAGKYPVGGYSEYWNCEAWTIGVTGPINPPPCPDPTDPCCPPPPGPPNGPPNGPPGLPCGAPRPSGSAPMPVSPITGNGPAPACGGGPGGLTYASREYTMDTGFGPGWSDADELPYLMGGDQNMVARFGAEQTVWFDAQEGGGYTARYGSTATLVHDSENDLFILTMSDGSRCEFFDYDQTAHPKGGLYRWVQPGGKTIEVTAWTQAGPWYRQVQVIAEVVDKTTPNGQAYQKREFTYVTTDDDAPHVQTLTLLAYDQSTSTWTNVRQNTYDYYGTGDSYGLPGDLKTIVTAQWDAATEDWIGDDTNYFRYWTENDAQTGAVEHGLKRVLLPNAYAAFVAAYGDPDDPQNQNAGDTQSDPISSYTCFYYEYDADHRVTNRIVFGKSNESDYEVTLSTNSRTANNWDRKTVETRLDGSTYTVYANFRGQTLLTDLYDPASETHTLTYTRYDSDGRVALTAEPSAFVLYGGKYYDDSLPDLVDYGSGDSPYLSDVAGLFQVTTYYATTSEGIDEDTSGGVQGYRHQTAVAHGETAARLTPGSQGGPILLSTYTYYARAVGDVTIYPFASQTTYVNEDGTGAITTNYAYTWYAGTFQVQEETITLPAVSTEQNGSGTSAVRKQWFDDHGNLAWSMDELGRVTYYGYDSLTGRLAQTIQDIDDATADELELDIPDGWTLPASGGVNLTTEYQHDAFGRITQTLGPAHTADINGTPTSVRAATWTFYNDATHETRSAQGYVVVSTSATVILGPISITKTDRDGRVTDRIQAAYTGDLEDLSTATISQSDYTAWTTYQYQKTRLVSSRFYHDIPTSGTGTSGVNYLQTTYGYETFGTGKMGRQNRTVAPDGTITRVVYDARGNVLETWIGTNDTGATDTDPTGGSAQGNNMVKVSSSTFDAEGNLSESRAHFGSGVNDYYATLYQYDWRDRLTDVLSPGDVVTHYVYDNLGRATWSQTYASTDFTLSAGELRAQTQSLFDDLGHVYESRLYEVDPDDGTVGDYLPSQTWYDARGYVVKTATANGLFQKYAYDGLGRLTAAYTSFDLDEEDYDEALDVAGDTVIQQTRTWYDQAGQAVATATYQRLPEDTSTTGVLDAANSYATAVVIWYDGLGRTVATANYGREDTGSGLTHYFFNGSTGALIDANANGIPDIAEDSPPEPYPQDPNSLAGIDFQLQLVQYDSAGRAYRTIDNLGRVNETQFDDAGRTVRTIQNYDDGDVDETDTDQDVSVEYEYDSGGRLVTMTAYNAKGSGNGVQSQATKYLYTSAINASWQTGMVYPDSTDTLSQDGTTKVWTISSGSDHVSMSYDRLGRTTSTTDQRGVVHDYTFDSAGRLSADTATSLGSSGIVDGTVRRIGTTYDDVGRVQTVTSYSDTAGTTAVNQVQYEYNGWGRVYREYEEHDGTVDGSTLFVQYDYVDGASGGVAKYVRLDQVTYPNGREVQYGYGTAQAIDDIFSRWSSISDSSGTLTSFKYLGAKSIVEEDYSDIDVKLSYLDGSGNVTGLDRFGRVVDQVWRDYGASETLDEYTYTYDRAGNRTSRDNELHSAFDEDYLYDALNRLTDADRADNFDQSWGLDGLGNFSSFDDDGTSQNRTVNEANQIQTISGSWVTPEYDAAGNMIFAPKSGDETTGLHFVRDAWNRLVAVYEDDGDGVYEPGTDDTMVARYEFDGRNRRIEKTFADDTGVEYFYNREWQLLEERLVDDEGATTAVNQHVWSPRYIDSPVVRFHDGNGDGDLLDGVDNMHYYTGDANFNVTATIDAGSGDVVNRYVYSAYGEATVYSPTWTNPAAATEDGPLYCGYWFDSETGNSQVRAREYITCLSTFDATDPLGYGGNDENLYRYVRNQPTSQVDPAGTGGHWEQRCVSAGTGAPGVCIDVWVEDPPPPTPGTGGPNAKRLGGIGYVFTKCCSSRAHHNTGFPGGLPAGVTPPFGPQGGQYETKPYPANPPAPIGGGGAKPCIIVVVKCPGFVSVFHFTPGDDPSGTLGQFSWPSGCSALVCGGTTNSSDGDVDKQSRCLADDVMSAAKGKFSPLQVAIGKSACGVDASGNWYAVNP